MNKTPFAKPTAVFLALVALAAAFYREPRDDAGAAEALRRARVELTRQTGEEGLVFRRRTVPYADPRYWAGFTLQGLP